MTLAVRWLVAGAALVGALAGAPGAGAAPGDPTVVARGVATLPTDVGRNLSAYRGRVVWSEWSPARKRVRLMTSFGGRVARVPVPAQAAPFDADVGPDRRGRPVIVYTRCRDFGRRGCDVYRFDFASGRERLVRSVSTEGASETFPSIWRDRIAFVRVPNRRNQPRVYVQRTGARSRPVSGGTIGNRDATYPRVRALDLHARQVGFVWELQPKGEACGEVKGMTIEAREVWTGVPGGPARRLATDCNAGEGRYQGISLAGKLASYALSTQEEEIVRRTDLDAGGSLVARIPPAGSERRPEIAGFAQDGDRSYLLHETGELVAATLAFGDPA